MNARSLIEERVDIYCKQLRIPGGPCQLSRTGWWGPGPKIRQLLNPILELTELAAQGQEALRWALIRASHLTTRC